jgi:hypothetical protein
LFILIRGNEKGKGYKKEEPFFMFGEMVFLFNNKNFSGVKLAFAKAAFQLKKRFIFDNLTRQQ